MHGRQLIEELRRHAADLLAMPGIGVHASGKTAGLLAQRFGALVVGAGRPEVGRREFVQHALANAHAWNDQLVQVQQFGERGEDHGGDADNFGAVAAHAEGVHAAFHVQSQNLPENFAQAAKIQGIEAGHTGAGSDAGQSFGIATASHRRAAANLRRFMQATPQDGADAALQRVERVWREWPG